MSVFRIKFEDPETREPKEVVAAFDDTPTVKAPEWAADYGYTLADKGQTEIVCLDPEIRRMYAGGRGLTVGQIAAKLKVGREMIRGVLK